MESTRADASDVVQAVPFFGVTDIEASLRFYVEGLGFALRERWAPAGTLGLGVSICFMCADAVAIYHEALARGLAVSPPYVGNRLWVTSFTDPDGYRLDFESPTDAPEGTVYAAPV